MQVEGDLKAALATVDELLLGDDSIPIQLRQHQGLDSARFERLEDAIEVLIEHYREKDEVPKKLALAFVDISNYFYFTESEYTEAELEKFEDAAHRLTYLASQLFSSSSAR